MNNIYIKIYDNKLDFNHEYVFGGVFFNEFLVNLVLLFDSNAEVINERISKNSLKITITSKGIIYVFNIEGNNQEDIKMIYKDKLFNDYWDLLECIEEDLDL